MEFVGTGFVPVLNSKEDSHKGCPYDNLHFVEKGTKGERSVDGLNRLNELYEKMTW
jgi:hypothetical protein